MQEEAGRGCRSAHSDELGDGDLVVITIAEIVAERLICAVVPNIAEGRAQRPIILNDRETGTLTSST